jgi:adenylosuccinate synthase
MLVEAQSTPQIIDSVYNAPLPNPAEFILSTNPLADDAPGKRPNSASIEDSALGDSGKGHVTQEVNDMLLSRSQSGELFSVRYNGTRNAGHEIFVRRGTEYVAVALHQLPVAATQEGATAIMGRGMLVHPDMRTEARYVEKKLGAALPGNLLIDRNATLSTDLHSALEASVNKLLGIEGSTASGVAEGYSSIIQKRAVTVRHFEDDKWRGIQSIVMLPVKSYLSYCGCGRRIWCKHLADFTYGLLL